MKQNVITYMKFEGLFKPKKDDPDTWVILGNEFSKFDKAQALDSYCMLRDCGIFSLPLPMMIEFVADPSIRTNMGFKILLAVVLPTDECIRLLLTENDRRLINIINRRIECENHHVDIDCELVFK